MSMPFQQKILRVVEYGVFTRVGGWAEVRSNARIIAATNVDLEARMQRGEFLRDLYDRLAFEVIRVPPLREREGDVELLARHFLAEFVREIPTLGGKRIARDVLEALRRYPFPGNVRELKTIIERAAYRDTTNELNLEDIGLLPAVARRPVDVSTPEVLRPSSPERAEDASRASFRERVEALERHLVEDALARGGGNQAEAARLLGLSYHQYRYYHRKYELG